MPRSKDFLIDSKGDVSLDGEAIGNAARNREMLKELSREDLRLYYLWVMANDAVADSIFLAIAFRAGSERKGEVTVGFRVEAYAPMATKRWGELRPSLSEIKKELTRLVRKVRSKFRRAAFVDEYADGTMALDVPVLSAADARMVVLYLDEEVETSTLSRVVVAP